MDSMTIYAFEENIPVAIIPAFVAANLNAATISTAPDFSKVRPRSELTFKMGSAASPQRIMQVPKINPLITGTATVHFVAGPPVTNVTFIASSNHNLNVGDNVLISLAADSFLNGTFEVSDVLDATSFRYQVTNLGSGTYSDPCTMQSGRAIPSHRAIAAYSGELEINSITDASPPGKSTMAAYRALVRSIMELDTLRFAVNLPSSPYMIDFISGTGGTDIMKTDDGYEICRLTYSVQFSIKQDAFDQLAVAA